MSVYQIIQQLAATSSRKEKEQIIVDNKGNETFVLVLGVALDPMVQFYMRKIPEYTRREDAPSISLNYALFEVLEHIANRNITGNAAISYVASVLSTLSEEDAAVLEMVILKDIKCGVGIATVNKALGYELVHEYPVMLCSAMNEKTLAKVNYPALVQLKMDGMRFNAIVQNGEVEFRTRNGRFIDLLGNLEEEFKDLSHRYDGEDIVFDGEMLVYENGKPAPRETGNGILNKAIKGTISAEEASKIHVTLWDAINYDEFVGHPTGLPERYATRFTKLSRELNTSPIEKIHLVTTDEVNTQAEAEKIFQRYLELGQEGIILKNKDGIWEPKRVSHQVKMKAENTADLLVVGYEPGTGKYEGMLGALKLQTSDGVIKVDVGTGFTDAQRASLTAENTIGKIVEIKYNVKVSDKRTGQQSLFLPVFLQIREDKTTADSAVVLK